MPGSRWPEHTPAPRRFAVGVPRGGRRASRRAPAPATHGPAPSGFGCGGLRPIAAAGHGTGCLSARFTPAGQSARTVPRETSTTGRPRAVCPPRSRRRDILRALCPQAARRPAIRPKVCPEKPRRSGGRWGHVRTRGGPDEPFRGRPAAGWLVDETSRGRSTADMAGKPDPPRQTRAETPRRRDLADEAHLKIPGRRDPSNEVHTKIPGRHDPSDETHTKIPGRRDPSDETHTKIPGRHDPSDETHAAILGQRDPSDGPRTCPPHLPRAPPDHARGTTDAGRPVDRLQALAAAEAPLLPVLQDIVDRRAGQAEAGSRGALRRADRPRVAHSPCRR